MTSSNPTLGAFNRIGAMGLSRGDTETMTVDGTIHKTGILGILLLIAFGLTWSAVSHEHISYQLPFYGGMLGGFVLALIISFNPTSAPYLSPAYAILEGCFIASFSLLLEMKYPHIVLQAAVLSFATLFAMLFAYRTGIIVVNNTFRAVIVGALMAIMFYYLIGMACLFFGITLPGIGTQGNWFSIAIQLVIAVVAALSLALDFDMIAENAGSAPKFMEWYGAFSLMVTMIWLYITLLRLLSSIRSRN
jgi:uncharacterized YccA/Bax inhibitor family protein